VFEISVRRHFYASHQLRDYPRDAGRPHRHRWEVRASVATPAPGTQGFGLDFLVLDDWLGEILRPLEGQVLNELPPFRGASPSAEQVARWIYGELAARLGEGPARLRRVEVHQGPRFAAVYEPGEPR
jgi:6-pyruvoyltetrahydropterin/6-carboxytetrahydropterin synthase